MNNELYHFGIKGMKWGIRRYQNKDGSYTPAGKKRYNDDSTKTKREQQIEKAEKELGRKVGYADFDRRGNITKSGLKKIKKHDELERRYEGVKKKDDPSFEWMRGFDPKYGVGLSNRAVERIVKKLEKNPQQSAMTLYKRERGKAFVGRLAKLGLMSASVMYLSTNGLSIPRKR